MSSLEEHIIVILIYVSMEMEKGDWYLLNGNSDKKGCNFILLQRLVNDQQEKLTPIYWHIFKTIGT